MPHDLGKMMILKDRMERLREEMLRVSGLLKKYEWEEKATEMRGAADTLKTWINGILDECDHD